MNYTVLGRRAGVRVSAVPPTPKRIENGCDDKTLPAHREILLETRYNREYIRRTTAPTFYATRLLVTRFGYQFVFFLFCFFRALIWTTLFVWESQRYFFFTKHVYLVDYRDLDSSFFVYFRGESSLSESKTELRVDESSLSTKQNYCISRCFSSKWNISLQKIVMVIAKLSIILVSNSFEILLLCILILSN